MEETRHATVLESGLQHLGSVYAKALLGACEKTGTSETVLAELDSVIRDVLERIPDFESTLVSPRIPFEAKEQLLDRAFGGKMSLALLNFLKVLARRGRFNCLRAVQLAAKKLLNELRGRVEVRLVTAEPIDNAMRDLIVAKVTAALGQEVDLQASVQSGLIGGLVIRVGDTVYDGSVANQLKQLRSELVDRAIQSMRGQADRFAVA